MKFTIYDKSTGRIIRTGSCPKDQFDIQSQEYSIAEGTYPNDEYYWDKGFKQMPPKPDGIYDFDYIKKDWVLNQPMTIEINRSKRNSLLLSSDWTQLPDVDLNTQEKTRWKQYRQGLRDMTSQDFLNGNFPIF